jgi:hypothetical protein
MNICEERHTPKYEVTYKGVNGSRYNYVWLVCPTCLENKKCFGDKDQILSVMAV